MRALRITSCMTSQNASRTGFKITTDGHGAYLSAVEDAFGANIDFAQLVKIYGAASEGPKCATSPPCAWMRAKA